MHKGHKQFKGLNEFNPSARSYWEKLGTKASRLERKLL